MGRATFQRGRSAAGLLPGAWVVALTGLLTAPMLMPGFVLSYDMVFTPKQDLLPASLGLGGGLPRAVPQDAVVALLEYVVPGMVLQKLVLLAIPLLTGFGMLRLLQGLGRAVGLVGATLAMLAPFVAERLVMGHWGLLLAYAIAPWAIDAARRARSVSAPSWSGQWPVAVTLLLLIAGSSLTPSGAILVTLLAVPIAIGPGSGLSIWMRIFIAVGAAATWLPWLIPALLHVQDGSADADGARVFALRSEGDWGTVLTALGSGGIWNAEVVPPSRTLIIAPLAALLVVALAVFGARLLWKGLGRAVALWWCAVALVGLAGALLSTTQAWGVLVSSLPGAGLLRDAHKLLAPLALLLAAAAGAGVVHLARRLPDRLASRSIVVAALLLPLLLQPDVLWGAGGRLRPVDYPASWQAMRDEVAESAPGDVLVLPWTAFRRYEWNSERTVLDPAPRWLTRTALVADGLLVQTPEGVVRVSGDDPRAEAVSAALDQGRDLREVLPALGVGWVLLDGPGTLPQGLTAAWSDQGLILARVPGAIVDLPPPPGWSLVLGVDLLLAILLGAGVTAALGARVRDANRRRHGESLLG